MPSSKERAELRIVVVSWHCDKLVERCLRGLGPEGLEAIAAARLEVVVVDNSEGEICTEWGEYFTGVTTIRNGHNLGFGRACNIGARDTDAEYLLFLNPDTEVSWTSVRSSIERHRNAPEGRVFALGIQLTDAVGGVWRSCSRFPTVLTYLVDESGLSRLRACGARGALMREWDHAQTRCVDQPMGAYLLIRSEMFRELDGFDERFFLYYEDVDLCRRAAARGYVNVYWAECRGRHVGGGASSRNLRWRLYCNLRGRLKYARIHFSSAAYLGAVAVVFIVAPLARTARALRVADAGAVRDVAWAWLRLLKRESENALPG
jgi:GT2 family glycosyltransferase